MTGRTFMDTLAVKVGKNHGMRLLFNGEELTDLGPEGMILSFIPRSQPLARPGRIGPGRPRSRMVIRPR